jgi:hypothetical protein
LGPNPGKAFESLQKFGIIESLFKFKGSENQLPIQDVLMQSTSNIENLTKILDQEDLISDVKEVYDFDFVRH